MSNTPVKLGTPVEYRAEDGANVVAPGTMFDSAFSQWYPSPNSEYVLILQEDGNLVLYEVIGTPPPLKEGVTFTGNPLWATGTRGEDRLFVQPDGNLVIYKNGSNDDTVLWASGTDGIRPAGLYLQNDGNLVLYELSSAWATGTNQ